MAKEPLRHTKCGQPLTLAVLSLDVAIYVYCNTCDDIIEIGEVAGVEFSQDDEGIEFNKRGYALFALEKGEVMKVG